MAGSLFPNSTPRSNRRRNATVDLAAWQVALAKAKLRRATKAMGVLVIAQLGVSSETRTTRKKLAAAMGVAERTLARHLPRWWPLASSSSFSTMIPRRAGAPIARTASAYLLPMMQIQRPPRGERNRPRVAGDMAPKMARGHGAKNGRTSCLPVVATCRWDTRGS